MSSISDDDKKTALMIVLIVSAFISVCMSTLIFVFYFLFSSFRKNFSSQLIIAISFLDILTWSLRIISSIYSLANDFETFENTAPIICQVFGFFFSFVNLMTFLLVLVIGISLYVDFVYSINLGSKKCLIYFLVFLIAFILATLDLCLGAYQNIPHDVKCWIRDYELRLLTFYSVLWIVFILDLFFMGAIIWKLKKMPINTEMQRKLALKFSLFPLAMFITWAPSSIRRIINDNSFGFEVFIYFITPLQGFLNGLAYGMINKHVKQKLIAFFTCDCMNLKKDCIKQLIETQSLNSEIIV